MTKIMKRIWKSSWLLAALFAAATAFAQNSSGEVKPTNPGSPSDQVRTIREQGKKVGRPENPRSSGEVSAVPRPEALQPGELRTMIERFQSERERFLARQKQLALQLRQATDEQRAELRGQMRENLEQWRELQLEFRTQLRERAVELRRELQGQLRDVVEDGGKEGTSGRPRE